MLLNVFSFFLLFALGAFASLPNYENTYPFYDTRTGSSDRILGEWRDCEAFGVENPGRLVVDALGDGQYRVSAPLLPAIQIAQALYGELIGVSVRGGALTAKEILAQYHRMRQSNFTELEIRQISEASVYRFRPLNSQMQLAIQYAEPAGDNVLLPPFSELTIRQLGADRIKGYVFCNR